MRIVMVGATAPSHVHPSLSLIRELVRRGHHVQYAIGEPLAGLVAPTGAEVVAHPTLLGDHWPTDTVDGMALFLDEGIAVLPHLLRAVEPPDLVLHDIGGLAGPVAAARWGAPAIQLSPTFVAWEGYEDDNADAIAELKSSERAERYYARFAAWLAEHGVDRSPDDVLARPERGLVLIPRVLQPEAGRVSDRFTFAGPCLDPERLAERWEPATDKPVLYVSFGTAYTDQPEAYRACEEAFAGEWELVVARDGRAPQLAILEHARAFVTHAGMGSAMEALWSGVPTVAIPQAVDQFANAARLAELGVSRTIDDVSPEALRAAVAAVTDDATARRLAAIRAEVRSSGGAERAADAIEA